MAKRPIALFIPDGGDPLDEDDDAKLQAISILVGDLRTLAALLDPYLESKSPASSDIGDLLVDLSSTLDDFENYASEDPDHLTGHLTIDDEPVDSLDALFEYDAFDPITDEVGVLPPKRISATNRFAMNMTDLVLQSINRRINVLIQVSIDSIGAFEIIEHYKQLKLINSKFC